MITHTPFRSWCPHCVAGQANKKGHFKRDDSETQGKPTIHLDYMFMNTEDGGQEESEEDRGMPIMVMSDQATGMCFSSVVPKKGVHPYAVLRVSNDLAIFGIRTADPQV